MSDINVKQDRPLTRLTNFYNRHMVPLPTVPRRELHHMNDCRDCRKTWLYFSWYKNDSEEWMELSEQERKSYLTKAERKMNEYVSRLARKKLSGYCMFRTEHPDADWKKATPEEKKVYIDKSVKEFEARKDEIKRLPLFIQTLLRVKKSEKTRKRKSTDAPTRPVTSFISFQRDRWHEFLRTGGVKNHENFVKLQTECKQEWSTNDELRERYTNIYQNEMVMYKNLKERFNKKAPKSVDPAPAHIAFEEEDEF